MTQKVIYRVMTDTKIFADLQTKQVAMILRDELKTYFNYKNVRVKKIILK